MKRKNKKQEKIEFEVPKWSLYSLVFLIIILIAGISVPAVLSPGEAGDPGHNIDSIGAPIVCDQDQFLIWNADISDWECSFTVTSGGDDTKCDSSGECSQVCIDDDCRTSWPIPTSPWNEVAEGLYYLSKVGIGGAVYSASPDLAVRGEIRAIDEYGNNRLWGKGRYNVAIESAWTQMGNGYKAELSNRKTAWWGAEQGCPTGTWVCRADEINADANPGSLNENAWLSDRGDSEDVGLVFNSGSSSSEAIATLNRVMCCAYGSCDSDSDGYESDIGLCSGTDCNDLVSEINPATTYSYRGPSSVNMDCDAGIEKFWSTQSGYEEYRSNVPSVANPQNIYQSCSEITSSEGCLGMFGEIISGSLDPTNCHSTWTPSTDWENPDAHICDNWHSGECHAGGAPFLGDGTTYYSWCK